MKLTLQMSDETYDHFVTQAEIMQGRGAKVTPEEVIVDRLERFRAIEPGDRIVVIDPKIRQGLENVLCGGSLMDAEDLLKKVTALASIGIGEIRLDFTPGQMKELKNLAHRNGRTVEAVFKDTVKRMESQFFNNIQ